MAVSRNNVNIAITAENRASRIIRSVRGDLNRLSSTARTIGRGITGAFSSVTSSLFSLRSGLVAVAGVAGLGFAVRSSYEYIDALGKLSTRIGITTAELQAYQVAANLSGGTTEGLNNSLDYFTRSIGEAKGGTGELRNVLNDLGISTDTLAFQNMSTSEALNLFMERLSGVSDETVRANYANRAFGRSGRTMANIVADNSAALTEARQRVSDLGIAIGEDTVRNVQRANDAFYLMQSAFTSIGNKILGSFAPALEKVSEWFANFFGGFSTTVEPYLNYLTAAIGEHLPQSFENARVFGEQLGHSFGVWLADLPNKIQTLVDKFNTFKTWLQTNGPTIWANVTTAAQGFLTVIETIAGAINGVINAYRSLRDFGAKVGASLAERSVESGTVYLGGGRTYKIPDVGGSLASGGAMQAGKSYMVGERGPEVVTPSRSGVVSPNGGGQTIINNIYTAATSHGINNALAARADTGVQTTRVGMNVRNSFAARGYSNLSSGRVR